MAKKDALDAYISGAGKLRMRPSARAEMLERLNDPQTAAQYSEETYRAKRRETAWRRFERWGGMAAILLVGFSFGMVAHTAIARQQTVRTDQQYIDAALGEYFSHFEGEYGGIIPHGSAAVSLFQTCRKKQIEVLRKLQLYENTGHSIADASCNGLLWTYVRYAALQARIMEEFSVSEPSPQPVLAFDFTYCADEHLLYFLAVNQSDSAVSYSMEAALVSDAETLHAQMQIPDYQRGWLVTYLNGTVTEDETTGAYAVSIPAHGAIQLAAALSTDTDPTETLWYLQLYAPNHTEEAALTASFTLDAEMQIDRAEEQRLLSAASAADATFSNQ